MDVKSLKIHNILSIADAELTFESTGLVLVEGFNYDDNRANGAGKTAIFNALSFVLYNKMPRKITATDILKKGEKSAFAEAVLVVGSNIYKIRRERPSKVIFYKNDEVVDMTQQEFESTIKLSYNQFLISMYTAQNASNRFIDLNDSEKKDFLLQLMNLDEFAKCKTETSTILGQLKTNLALMAKDKENIESQAQIYRESLATGIDGIEGQIDKNEHDIVNALTVVDQLRGIPKPNFDKYVELENDIRTKREDLMRVQFQRNNFVEQFNKLNKEAAQPVVLSQPDAQCPYCDEPLKIDGKNVAEADDHEKVKEQYAQKVARLQIQIQELQTEIDQCDEKLETGRELPILVQKLNQKKQEMTNKFDIATQKVSDLRILIQKRRLSNTHLAEKLENRRNTKQRLSQLSDALIKLEVDISNQRNEIMLHTSLSSMFSPTGAQAYIMDYIVDSFNNVIGNYIDIIWPNASYELRTHKENKAGEVSAKFADILMIDGQERAIGSLSGGELRSLSLAIDFAVVKILGDQFSIQLNPVILDEPFNSLDVAGKEKVMELLEILATERQLWVIDHSSEIKAQFSSIVRVEKRHGTSVIAMI